MSNLNYFVGECLIRLPALAKITIEVPGTTAGVNIHANLWSLPSIINDISEATGVTNQELYPEK